MMSWGDILLLGLLSLVPYLVAGSSTLCGTSPARHCSTSDSYCQSGRCNCADDTTGNGYLGCFPSGTKICTLLNDPILETLRHDRISLPVPCRYHVMEYESIYHTRTDKWTFSTTVSGFNERIKGKIYVKGYDILVQYKNIDSVVKGEFHLRVKGSYTEGVYEFERAVLKPDAIVWAPVENDGVRLDSFPFDDNYITVKIDSDNHRTELIIPFTYLKIHFRPANPVLGKNQTFVPGLSVGVTETDPDLISWDGFDNVAMCLTPEGNDRPSAEDIADSLYLNKANAFIVLAFLATDSQLFPGASQECGQVAGVVQQCTHLEARQEAMAACAFILSWPHFVNCWEYSGAGVDSEITLGLYKVCMDAFCRRSAEECESIRAQVSEHTCAKWADPLLVLHDCSFHGNVEAT